MSSNDKQSRIERLNAVAEQKKQDALDATEQAINRLLKEGKVISFNSVAREAEVSTAYLYKYPELKQRIMKLREEQKASGKKTVPPASDSSKNRIITHLRQRIQQLENEKSELRHANESLAGRVFELENYESLANRLRNEVDRLTDEVVQLRLALSGQTQSSKSKITPLRRKPKTIPDVVQAELDSLNIEVNSTLRKLLLQTSERAALKAIDALKYALANQEVKNPAGWLAQAIKNRWTTPSTFLENPKQHIQQESTFPEGFEEWYLTAVDVGYVVNEAPLEMKRDAKGDPIVKVNKPTATGIPYSQMSWREAKLLMANE